MKAVILAGGLGTRLAEETDLKPKPMVEIGGKPMLWHIMKIYASHDIQDFVICCGYKGYLIKEYFANYFLHMSDVTFNMRDNSMHVHTQRAETWNITLVDTGEDTMTGGRLSRVANYIQQDDIFCFTYGDGLSDVNITKTIDFHRKHGKLATLVAANPPSRFGILELEGQQVRAFQEKPIQDSGLINGGFFVLSPEVLNYLDGDACVWEQGPLMRLASEGQLMAYEHAGFWQPMDTLREKQYLEGLWCNRKAPWKVWE